MLSRLRSSPTYVDGQPVPETGRVFDANLPIGAGPVGPVVMFGVAPNVSAGTHTVTISRKTTTGDVTAFNKDQGAVGAIALGNG